MTDDLHDLSFRFLSILSIRGQLHYNFVSIHCPSWFFNRYKYVLIQSLVIRNHEPKLLSRLHAVKSDYFWKPPLQDLHDLSFTASSFRFFCKYDLNMISVKCTTGIIRTDEYILWISFVQHYKAKSLKTCPEHTGQTLCMSPAVFSSLGKIYLSFLLQRFQDLS